MSDDNPSDNEDQCRLLHQTLAELGLIQGWKDYVLHTSPAQTVDDGVAPSLEYGLLRTDEPAGRPVRTEPIICVLLDFRRKFAARPEGNAGDPPPSSRKEYFYVEDGLVKLECPLALIPNGLGWLRLTESDGTLTVVMPELKFNKQEQNWWMKQSIERLLKKKLKGVTARVEFVVATSDNRDEFQSEQVRTFVNGLKDGTHQKHLAVAFLKGNHNA